MPSTLPPFGGGGLGAGVMHQIDFPTLHFLTPGQVGSVDYIAEMFELPPDVVAAVAHCQNSAMTVVLAGVGGAGQAPVC